jgi:hypothetical protein
MPGIRRVMSQFLSAHVHVHMGWPLLMLIRTGAPDLFHSLGGDTWWDRKLGIGSREHGALFVRRPPFNIKTATLLLEGTIN